MALGDLSLTCAADEKKESSRTCPSKGLALKFNSTSWSHKGSEDVKLMVLTDPRPVIAWASLQKQTQYRSCPFSEFPGCVSMWGVQESHSLHRLASQVGKGKNTALIQS